MKSYYVLIVLWLLGHMWLGSSMAFADVLYTFAQFECDETRGAFQIAELRSYNEEGEALANQPGGIELASLLVRVGEGDSEALVPGKKHHREECKLGRQTYIADVSPSKGISASGMCGAEPPSILLSVSVKGASSPFIKGLEFNRSCYDFQGANVLAVKILGRQKRVAFSIGSLERSFESTFLIDKISKMTREEIIRSVTLPSFHLAAVEHFKKTGSAEGALDIFEAGEVATAVTEKPDNLSLATYVSILNDYGFFLGQTDDRYGEAIPILQKVIRLSPRRHVAYLNLGDAYGKSLDATKDPVTKKQISDLVMKNYRGYARLIASNKIALELPQRVKDALDSN